MQNTLANPSELTLNIVLATMPQKQEKEFDQSIREGYFEKFRTRSAEYCSSVDSGYLYSELDGTNSIPTLYNPIRYYLLGNYDIAYISLIDNFKFAHRLFESVQDNKSSAKEDPFSPHTFQSFTGINYNEPKYLKDFFYGHLSPVSTEKKYFLGICNLKVNNGFLIGNGNTFLNEVCKIIKSVINSFNKKRPKHKKVDFLFIQSFSWFEISLILFTNDPSAISTILRDLRGISVKDLVNYQTIMDESLYRMLLQKLDDSDLKMANIFADTHTYFGLHADLIDNTNEDDNFTKSFLDVADKIKLKTDIEWQIKPGHMHLLINELKEIRKKSNIDFKLSYRFLLTGKTDYFLQKTSDNILTNYYLLKIIFDSNNKLFDHVRKIRTKVIFKSKSIVREETVRQSFSLNDPLKELAITGTQIKLIDEKLKALKISRQIKSKILKIFSNYNNGIQDIILFPFFLDFKIFIDELFDFILEEYNKWSSACAIDSELFYKTTLESMTALSSDSEKDLQSVNELEIKLIKRINVFEEGYNLRVLNCYLFEDIPDFDLDFNSSVQQLLSAYSSLVIELGNIFYDQTKKYQFGPIIQLNLTDTKGNYNSINYHVLHLISPEFIFATVTKEILNNEEYDSALFQPILESYNKEVKNLEIDDPYLFDMCKQGIIDFNYFMNDSIRFVITYDLDFKLFYYWFWTYNLQNPLLYDKRGLMNENHLKKELFRIIIIAKYFKVDLKDIYCPLPELFTYWERHYDKLSQIADVFLNFLERKDIVTPFSKYLMSRFDIYLELLIPAGTSVAEKKDASVQKLKKFMKTMMGYEANMYNVKQYYSKDEIFSQFSEGKEIPTDASLLNIQYQMMKYLKSIFESNNGKINYLRRDWVTGMPLKSFISANTSDHLYSVDQTGGVFFDDIGQLNKYFKSSSLALNSILHYSMVLKRDFIKNKIENRIKI